MVEATPVTEDIELGYYVISCVMTQTACFSGFPSTMVMMDTATDTKISSATIPAMLPLRSAST